MKCVLRGLISSIICLAGLSATSISAWATADEPVDPSATGIFPFECDAYNLTMQTVMDPTQTPIQILLHYRAPDHHYDNAFGDVALIRYALDVPWGLYWQLGGTPQKIEQFKNWIMLGKPCALQVYHLKDRDVPTYNNHFIREPNQKEINVISNLPVSAERRQQLMTALQKRELFFQGNANPVIRDGFIHMVEQVVGEFHDRYHTDPQVGAEPGWSSRILWSLRPEDLPVMAFPKLFIALCIGESSRYLTTGQENALLTWMLSRSYRSIEPYDLLRESFELNQGNMMDTLLTIENILSRHWRHPHREALEQTLRLTPITNQFGDDRNLFGNWYHFFGLVLYGYAHSGWESGIIGHVETAGSQILSHFKDEEGETQVNAVGAQVGADIHKVMTSRSWQNRLRIFDYSRKYLYLNLTQSFSRELMSWQPNQAPSVGIHNKN